MRSITETQQSGIGTWKSTLGNWQPAIAFAVVAAFLTIVPAIVWGIPSNLDLTNHFRFALPFYDAIAAGDLYPGWLAESNGGYGDPSFRFYPPALYYLLAAARFVIGNWYGATLVVFVMVSIAGALGMYFWARSILSSSERKLGGFLLRNRSLSPQSALPGDVAGRMGRQRCVAVCVWVCRKGL